MVQLRQRFARILHDDPDGRSQPERVGLQGHGKAYGRASSVSPWVGIMVLWG
jgi:hypothetical protein